MIEEEWCCNHYETLTMKSISDEEKDFSDLVDTVENVSWGDEFGTIEGSIRSNFTSPKSIRSRQYFSKLTQERYTYRSTSDELDDFSYVIDLVPTLNMRTARLVMIFSGDEKEDKLRKNWGVEKNIKRDTEKTPDSDGAFFVVASKQPMSTHSIPTGEGFGYAQDQYFNHHRIPQTGNVIIGNKVTIGALNTIDRGTYGPTVIGDGCIFDNMCHVAHTRCWVLPVRCQVTGVTFRCHL